MLIPLIYSEQIVEAVRQIASSGLNLHVIIRTVIKIALNAHVIKPVLLSVSSGEASFLQLPEHRWGSQSCSCSSYS